ncbi:DUF5064 family protein [Pseudomonas sp. USHLN015]|uniref:DUF5064 family protein n=1 Tax=Pseudomonas sp. USHLN015 TaxID=3081296 RepID=UPI00301C9B17
MQFRLLGEVDGERFEEAFASHRDIACHFACVVSRIVAKHGLPLDSGPHPAWPRGVRGDVRGHPWAITGRAGRAGGPRPPLKDGR